jgi:hypothetical protein
MACRRLTLIKLTAVEVLGETPVKMVADAIPGYSFGEVSVPRSPVSIAELRKLKQTVGWTLDDKRHLTVALSRR